MYGIYVRIVHTGLVNTTLQLTDIYPTTDGHTAYRRTGPVYVPIGGTTRHVYLINFHLRSAHNRRNSSA
jgi:hypothetical protein